MKQCYRDLRDRAVVLYEDPQQAAFLDQTTNYYEHTGIQTVARSLILQAYSLVKEEIKLVMTHPMMSGLIVTKFPNC